MTTKTYKKYIAFDGTEFNTAEECINYEEKKKEVESLLRAVKRVKEICSGSSDCEVCPFLKKDNGHCPFHVPPYNFFAID